MPSVGMMDDSLRQDTGDETTFKPTRKRRRVVISCTECHRRKQKCDRQLPCANCVFRNKQSACRYETESSLTKHRSGGTNRNRSSSDGSRSPVHESSVGVEHMKLEDSAAQLSALGYAKSNGHNSLGIIRKIESHEGGGQNLSNESTSCLPDYNGLKERYKSLVRQLPARSYVDQLLVTFFHEVNWHYGSIDEVIFMEHLQDWNKVSFSVLNRGPQDLPRDIRYFPALLFQVLALSLQFQSPNYDPTLDSLKYVSEMSLDDLASDYSESGLAILSLLGKRDITLVTIQAGFLRTSFLKNSGLVTESWHSLGQTIRDAQEIGWHRDPVDRSKQSPEKALEALWLIEVRRRVWVNLQIWDIHMALVLGRPTSIDFSDLKVTLPMDTTDVKDRRGLAPLPRSESEPPTPVTMIIINCSFITILRDILFLEREGVHPKDYTKVDRVHEAVVTQLEHIPPCFRFENPVTSFDSLPGCQWLPASRQLFESSAGFVIMTLHKPYVFTNVKSRHEALKASLTILRAQRRLFLILEAQHYKLFNLVLSTFDAIVLLSAIYVLHPTENPEYLNDSLQHFEWAMERFELMSDRNQMAKSALGVLQAIHVRFKKAIDRRYLKPTLNGTKSKTRSPTPRLQAFDSPASNSSSTEYNSTPQMAESLTSNLSANTQQISKPSNLGIPEYSGVTDNSNATPLSKILPSLHPDTEWQPFPSDLPGDFHTNFDFSGIAPLQPTHDLLFNDLVGISDDPGPAVAANAQTYYDAVAPWQFEGEFRDDSFWNFMNQYSL